MKKTPRPIVILAFLAVVLVAFVLVFRQRLQKPEPGPVSGKLVVHFLDIGQGDSEVIELPDGETILIDSGDRAAPTVDLLQKYRVRQIDLIIATHPHSDHMGEMRDVMRAFKVQEFWDSGFNHPTKTYTDMLQEIKDRGIKFSRQWIAHLMKENKFPKTVMLGQGHSVGFIESEIDEWIENLIRERDGQAVES